MKSSKLKVIAIIAACLMVSSSLCACSTKKTQTQKDPSNSQTQTQTQTQKPDSTETQKPSDKTENQQSSGNLTLDAYNEKINYYMELVETLQAEILEIKEENYVEVGEYKAKIKELEATVSQLLDRIETILAGNLIAPPNADGSLDAVTKKNEFEYTISDGKAVITKYVGTNAEVEIPEYVDGYSVFAIGEEAFKNCNVTKVTIPNTVRKIDWFAFAGCASLQSITVPASVTSIEYGAFDYCPKSMKIYCSAGSYAEAYAQSWGLTLILQ